MARRSSFRKINTTNTELMRVQDAVAESLNVLNSALLTEARLIPGVLIGTSATPVEHGLGREPQGWFVVDANTGASLWRSSSPPVNAPAKLLYLQASTPVTVTLVVF